MGREFRIVSPCSRDRDSLDGDGPIRWCPECRQHVYDFAGLRRREIAALAARGGLCAIVERDARGELRTADPPPLRRRALQWIAATAGGLLLPLSRIDGAAAESTLDGKVVDESGAPIAGAAVSTSAGSRVPTNAAGEFRFRLILAGDYTVRVTLDGYIAATELAIVKPGKATSLQPIVLRRIGSIPPGTITGLIEDENGAWVSGARLTLTAPDGRAWKSRSDDEGRFTVNKLPPRTGNYRLKVEAAGFQTAVRDNARPFEQITLKVGSTGQVIEVQQPHPIRRLWNRLKRSSDS